MFGFVSKRVDAWRQGRAQAPLKKVVEESLRISQELEKLSAEELSAKIPALKEAVTRDGLAKHKAHALALACVASSLMLDKKPFKTQRLAALGLHSGALVQLGTGEGKTLAAPLAAFLAFLEGERVHVSTANDYLAQRDARNMLNLYTFLGMTVGFVTAGGGLDARRQVYSCAVVYGTHQVFALDYLRDRLAIDANKLTQPPLGYAFVDEADAVLIDEARTPLTISDFHPSDTTVYSAVAKIAETLTRGEFAGEGDFWLDGKDRVAILSDTGYEKVDAALEDSGLLTKDSGGQYGAEHQGLIVKVQMALAANYLLLKDHHYVLQDKELVLVDALTGRLLPGRRWDSGLQQALEWKEGLALSPESSTRATITLQNYFRQYKRLAGMTGTAMQEAEEFEHVYGLGVLVVEPNVPSVRKDHPSRIFRTQQAKLAAVVEEVQARHTKNQPVLIGTASVEQSEELAEMFKDKGLKVEVLNAKEHEREAEIMASAGRSGAITVTTSMAGRGVDIPLGGALWVEVQRQLNSLSDEARAAMTEDDHMNLVAAQKENITADAQKVRDAGGLLVLGLERYESRRMDGQLRGRAGRQGDPGETCFYISLEDPLVENFAGEYLRGVLNIMDIKEGTEQESLVVTQAVDGAQKQMEARAFSARKTLLQFDNVLNEQRVVFYQKRQSILTQQNALSDYQEMVQAYLASETANHMQDNLSPETWDLPSVIAWLTELGFDAQALVDGVETIEGSDELEIGLQELMVSLYSKRHTELFNAVPDDKKELYQNHLARMSWLYGMDKAWAEHLEALDALRQGIYLRAHAKVDPIQAYKKEAYKLFAVMLDSATAQAIGALLRWTYTPEQPK